ncbi:ABC transporter substrate-binding protein [Candidatus Poribacteria bacterium]|nr:ABC transporter substrate-binding protein [Candidatus Poribacteria bacterium]
MTDQRSRLTRRKHIGQLWILLPLILSLFWGCDQVQQLLAPLSDGGDADTVKIGFLYTTPNRNNSRYGAELATTQLNEARGVRDIPIQLVARGIPTQRFVSENINETEYVSKLALELIIEEEVSAIVGPNRSTYAVIVGEIAQNHGIPMMATSATNPSVTAAGDFVFMAAFTDDFQGVAMAAFALQDLEAKTAAVLTHTGDVYSEGLSQTFIDSFNTHGGQVVADEFYAAGDTDFTVQLTVVAEATPDVIFSTGFIPEVPLLVRQAREEVGITATFIGGDAWDNTALIEAAGAAIDGSFFSSGFSAEADPSDLGEDAYRFVTAYTAMFGVVPDGGAALGYDALRLVVQAMRRANDLTPIAIRDQLAATMNYSGATFISGYDENRHTSKSVVIKQIVNGEVQFHKLIEP